MPDTTNTTPLNSACFGDGFSSSTMRFNAVNELINNNADVNVKELDGSTALIRAASSWVLELLSSADILELSSTKNGIGDPSGNKFYYDANGGIDLYVRSETAIIFCYQKAYLSFSY